MTPNGSNDRSVSRSPGSEVGILPKRLCDVQEPTVNFYILVPFTTSAGALWGEGYIDFFDTHVISAADVNQEALVVTETEETLDG